MKNVKRLETTTLKLSIKFSNRSSFDPPVSEDLPFSLQAHTGRAHEANASWQRKFRKGAKHVTNDDAED